jgi:hypothetical protein
MLLQELKLQLKKLKNSHYLYIIKSKELNKIKAVDIMALLLVEVLDQEVIM